MTVKNMSKSPSPSSHCPKPHCPLLISLPDEDALPVTTEEPLLTAHAPKCLSTSNRNLEEKSRSGVNSPKARMVFQFAEGRVRPKPPNEPKTCVARSPNRYIFATQSNEKLLNTVKPPSRPTKPSTTKVTILAKPMSPSPPSSLSTAVTQVPRSPASSLSSEQLYREHLFQTFQAMRFVKQIKQADPTQLRERMVLLAKRSTSKGRKTVVFDLDETLVHCVEDLEHAQVVIPVVFPSGESIRAGVNIRPFARECLMAANCWFEVMVFTASHKCYADRVLDYLDPSGELIHHRLYRDSCLVTDGVFIKDLRILANRRLQDLVIIDNAAYSFAYQLDNGVPIISWYDDPRDRELYNLIEYLRVLSDSEDVRVVNRQTFQLYRFFEDYQRQFREDKENKECIQ